jgi:hypothetical protein
MSERAAPTRRQSLKRADVVAMLASYGDRDPAEVGEEFGSLELTWLVAQVEQRYSVVLDLDDDVFAGMLTVTGALGALRTALDQPAAEPAAEASAQPGAGAAAGAGDG